jgi:flagellar motor switch protein FliM
VDGTQATTDIERALEVLHEDFATDLQDLLRTMTRRDISVRLASAGRGSFGQFVLCQSNPTCCFSIAATPLDADYFLAIQPRILYPLLDHALGTSDPEPMQHRPLTEIEAVVARKIVEEMIPRYQRCWQPVLSLDSQVDRLFRNAQHISVMCGMQAVYLVRYDVECGVARGWLELSLPWDATQSMRERLAANHGDAATIARR